MNGSANLAEELRALGRDQLKEAERRLIEGTNSPPASVLLFLESLYQDEYTGLIVLHFCQGVAKKAEFPVPGRQIPLAK